MHYDNAAMNRSLRSWPRRPAGGLLLAALCTLAACSGLTPAEGPDVDLVDPEATFETRALVANLERLAPDYVLFGHEDDLAYGVEWVREDGRSDVRDVTGSYPAVYGWDLGDLEHGAEANLDGVRFDDMQRWMREAYARGGVNTVSWHMDNPASGGTSWDTTTAIPSLLPGGDHHDLYTTWLDRFAEFNDGLRGPDGERIPLIFRPFHEMTGGWFWWGKGNTTPEDYKQIWRFTVEYLRDEKGLDNLLYAYSTDIFEDEAQYLEHYPGDDYVDLLGMDNYHDLRTEEGVANLTRRLRMLVEMAEARGKLAAFTEGGLEGIPVEDWWTNRLLRAIEADPAARRIAYVLMWRNAPNATHPGHYYAPYPGQASADDFVRFYEHPGVLFERELPDLYAWPSSFDALPPAEATATSAP